MVELLAEAMELPDPESVSDRRLRSEIAIGKPTDAVDRPKITDARAAELRKALPDDPVELRAGRLACAECGVSVKASTPVMVVPLINGTRVDGSAPRKVGQVALARCPGCTERHRLAEEIADSHPAARKAVGGLVTAAVDHALLGVQLLGKPVPGVDVSDRVLGSLLRNLSRAAGVAAWSSAPREGVCSPYPWAHVRTTVRARILRAWVGHLNDLESAGRPDVSVRPPSAEPPGRGMMLAGACLFCGRPAVVVPARQVHGQPSALRWWTSRSAVPSASLGGPTTAAGVKGWLCSDCDLAVADDGAIGPTSIRIALARHADDVGDSEWAKSLRAHDWTFPTWAGLGVRARLKGRPLAPNTRPWGHLDRQQFLRPPARQHSELWEA